MPPGAGIVVFELDTYTDPAGTDWSQIWAVPFGGGTPYAITTTATDQVFDGSPEVSPDFTQVAFIRDDYGGTTGQLVVINADGSGELVLDASGTCVYPTWAPDSSKILYRIGNTAYTINPDGTGKTALHTSAFLMFGPVFNTDGSLIAFTVDANNPTSDTLWVMNADGSSPTSIDTLGTNGRGGYGITWAGASVIVYSGSFDGTGSGKLYKINADGSGKTALTTGGTPYNYLVTDHGWAGGAAVYGEHALSSPFVVYEIPLDGSGQAAISPALDGFGNVNGGRPIVADSRIYVVDNATGDLVSVLLDGSDRRTEVSVTYGPTVYETAMLASGQG